MASISNDPNGRRRILFVAPDGSRKTIRLGKTDRRSAEAIARHVEALLSAQIGGQPIPRDTASWLAGIADALKASAKRLLHHVHDKLVIDWRRKADAYNDVLVTIQKVLDEDLPADPYPRELFEAKVQAVFEHVAASYGDDGRSVYATESGT